MNCLWNVHLKWGMSVANIIKNAYLIAIMSLNDLSVVNKTKKRPPFHVLKIKCCSSYTEYRNEIGCFTNFNMYHSWWHSPFLRRKVIMIGKLSISRSTYLLKRRVSFFLITTGYTSHVFFFTTECCDFGDRQPCGLTWRSWFYSMFLMLFYDFADLDESTQYWFLLQTILYIYTAMDLTHELI
jgi:hypothetical protein